MMELGIRRREGNVILSLYVLTVRSPLTALTHSQIHPCAVGEEHQAQLYGHGEALLLSEFGCSILAKRAPKFDLDFSNLCQAVAHSGMQGTHQAGQAQLTPWSCSRHGDQQAAVDPR